jgi:hypothetical protein
MPSSETSKQTGGMFAELDSSPQLTVDVDDDDVDDDDDDDDDDDKFSAWGSERRHADMFIGHGRWCRVGLVM